MQPGETHALLASGAQSLANLRHLSKNFEHYTPWEHPPAVQAATPLKLATRCCGIRAITAGDNRWVPRFLASEDCELESALTSGVTSTTFTAPARIEALPTQNRPVRQQNPQRAWPRTPFRAPIA